MSDDDLVNEFARKVSSGEITFDKIRPQLEQQGIEDDRIGKIVRRIDDEVQAALISKSSSSSFDRVIFFGMALFVFGALSLLASLAGLFSVGAGYMALIAYGPVIAGLVLIVIGKRKKNSSNTGLGSSIQNRKFRLRDRESD